MLCETKTLLLGNGIDKGDIFYIKKKQLPQRRSKYGKSKKKPDNTIATEKKQTRKRKNNYAKLILH